MRQYILLLTFTAILHFVGNAQDCLSYFQYSKYEISEAKMCPEAMTADIKALHEHILNTHPNPTLYCSVEGFVQAYKKALAACSTEKTMIQFIQIITEYLSVMKDSHTNLNPKDYLFLGPKERAVLPFFVIKIDGKFYLDGIYKSKAEIGSEVLSVNGITMDSLFQVSKKLSFTEGNAHDAQEEIALQMIGATFNLIQHATLSDKAQFKLVNLTGDTVTFAASYVKSIDYLKDRGGRKEEAVSYFIDSKNRCVLTIQSFDPYSYNKFKRRIDACFAEVKKRGVSDVYIDLRDNLGGMLRAQEYVLSYLNKSGRPIQMNYLYKRSRYDRFALLPFYQEWQFKNRAERVYPNGLISQEFDFYKSPLGTTKTILYEYPLQNNLSYTYPWKCTLMMNGSSMSASVLFAGWFKQMNRGEIIGSPCMGSVCGTFGNSAPYTLRYSNLHVSVSTLKFTPKNKANIELSAIQPNHFIRMTRQQLIDQKDPIYEFLGIEKNQKRK
jgi:C-terminal processing protease CtpA/Prc